MSPRNTAEIAFGVLGVYLLGSSIPQAIVGIGVGLSERHADPLLLWVGLVATLFQAAFGAVLLAARCPLAQRLAPSSQEQAPETGATVTHAAAISVVGVYFVAAGLSSLLRELIGAVHLSSMVGSALQRVEYSTSTPMDSFAQPIASIAVGAALFLGSRGISNLWRAAGVDHGPESSE